MWLRRLCPIRWTSPETPVSTVVMVALGGRLQDLVDILLDRAGVMPCASL